MHSVGSKGQGTTSQSNTNTAENILVRIKRKTFECLWHLNQRNKKAEIERMKGAVEVEQVWLTRQGSGGRKRRHQWRLRRAASVTSGDVVAGAERVRGDWRAAGGAWRGRSDRGDHGGVQWSRRGLEN